VVGGCTCSCNAAGDEERGAALAATSAGLGWARTRQQIGKCWTNRLVSLFLLFPELSRSLGVSEMRERAVPW
jgi:hypothetical protein